MDQRGMEATVEGQCQEKDWINQLPNCLLECIISLLTIKAAVHTGMVSRRWRHLWLDPILLKRRNLEFDIQNVFGSTLVGPKFKLECSQSQWKGDFKTGVFINRVNTFLQLYNGQKIDSFKVSFFLGGESSRVLDEWIHFAITKGVEELHLHLFPRTYDKFSDYVFPSSLLSEQSISTLKCLSLRRCILEPPLDFDKFSQLTNLHLYTVDIDGGFMEPLFSVCLFLESLTLKDCSLMNCKLIIVGPDLRLKDLKVLCCKHIYKVDIYAVNLASLEYTEYIPKSFSIKAPQLTRIFVQPKFPDVLPRVLSQFALFSSVETLNLQVFLELPQFEVTFRNLKQLIVEVLVMDKDDRRLDCIMNLLKVAPVLEELTIRVIAPFQKEGKIENCCGFTHNHLKEVKIQGFCGTSYEIMFLIRILESTTKLERMAIHSFGKVYMGDGIWDRVINERASAWTKKQRRELTQLLLQEKLENIKTNAQIVIQ